MNFAADVVKRSLQDSVYDKNNIVLQRLSEKIQVPPEVKIYLFYLSNNLNFRKPTKHVFEQSDHKLL